MGEVYRAHDSRLRRDVAIKVLPSAVSGDSERLRRFEQEARAAAALNHPNILTVHEIGRHDGQPYVASELLEGQTLRSILRAGALPLKKTVDYAIQLASGLAAAHDKGIVHRDVKPENLIVTADARLKILDFGLAKLTESVSSASQETWAVDTVPGVVLGTAGYMSPEQVRGQPVDHRTDIFAFGCVLYEMLSGRRPFKGDTPAETMAAILNAEPDPPSSANSAVPRAFDRIVQRCLNKDAAQRFQSARDIAFSIEAMSGPQSDLQITGANAGAGAGRSNRRRVGALAAAGVALIVAGSIVGRLFVPPALASPRVTRLTFERGGVSTARFTGDGNTVVYAAAWGGEPTRVFQTRLGASESSPVQLPDAELLAISPVGELAIATGSGSRLGRVANGTLARAPLVGGTLRDVLDDISAADWSHDGAQLAVVRRLNGTDRLEYPIGTVRFETTGYVDNPRISPAGDAIAFLHHPEYGKGGGQVTLVTFGQESKRLGHRWNYADGLAWSPDGREVWFTAGEAAWSSDASIWGVTRDGVVRKIWSVPLGLTLHDVAQDGRALLTGNTTRNYIGWFSPGATVERDASWFSLSAIQDLSPDGTSLLLTRQDEGAGPNRQVGLRRVDPSTAVQLGAGIGIGFSPDGKWALARLLDNRTKLVMLPTGAGESREIAAAGLKYTNAGWFPDGKRIVFVAQNEGEPQAAYVQDVTGGTPRRIATAVSFATGGAASLRVSPDGQWFTGPQTDGPPVLLPIGGGEPRHLPGLTAEDRPINWGADGRTIFIERGVPAKRWAVSIVRYDLATSQTTPVRQIELSDTAGMSERAWCQITPDGRVVVYVVNRHLTDLYVVEGLK